MRLDGTAESQFTADFCGLLALLTVWTGALTGLTSASVTRRKARVLAHDKIHGPFVAHPKFGPYSGLKPVPFEGPYIASECNESHVAVLRH